MNIAPNADKQLIGRRCDDVMSEWTRQNEYDSKIYMEGYNDGYDACIGDTQKYRWHNLRKNPEDLPEENQDVLAYMCYSKTKYEYIVVNANDCQRISESRWEALGWKYIEQFNGA